MTDNAKELLEDLKTLTNKILLELVAENEDLEEQLKDKGEQLKNKGEWIRTRTWEHDGELYCSVCGFAPYDERDCDNFCPSCGIKMKRVRK